MVSVEGLLEILIVVACSNYNNPNHVEIRNRQTPQLCSGLLNYSDASPHFHHAPPPLSALWLKAPGGHDITKIPTRVETQDSSCHALRSTDGFSLFDCASYGKATLASVLYANRFSPTKTLR